MINSADEFVCNYEDAKSIALKCEFIQKKNMLGAMYLEYAGDDNEGNLMKAVFKGVNKK